MVFGNYFETFAAMLFLVFFPCVGIHGYFWCFIDVFVEGSAGVPDTWMEARTLEHVVFGKNDFFSLALTILMHVNKFCGGSKKTCSVK